MVRSMFVRPSGSGPFMAGLGCTDKPHRSCRPREEPEVSRRAVHLRNRMMKRVRLGYGAGYAGDRLEPAVELAESGALDYLVFECLAERTVAFSQLAKLKNPRTG